jgi:hypothetical protein
MKPPVTAIDGGEDIMVIKLKRAYEPPEPGDGFRVLVDRLWPRGVSKSAARIDLWRKKSRRASRFGNGSVTTRRNGAHSGLVTSGSSRRTARRPSSSWRMCVTAQ